MFNLVQTKGAEHDNDAKADTFSDAGTGEQAANGDAETRNPFGEGAGRKGREAEGEITVNQIQQDRDLIQQALLDRPARIAADLRRDFYATVFAGIVILSVVIATLHVYVHTH